MTFWWRGSDTITLYTLPAPAFARAVGYARAYAADGGEAARILRKNLAARTNRTSPPAHPCARGIVLEIEAPRGVVHAFRDLDTLRRRVRRAWDDREDWALGFHNLDALFADITDFEAHLTGPVPSRWIVAAHDAGNAGDPQ